MRVLLTGGGTAGHINPALAIAEIIQRNAPGSEIAFVGIQGGKEEELVPREGYPLHYVQSKGIAGSPIQRIKAMWLALRSPKSKQTQQILDDFQPDIVIGTGGYACWPILCAAANRGIPTAVHESNAAPGKAVKQLQWKVDRVWINFARTAKKLCIKRRVVRVGNPLRGGFGACSKSEARQRLGIPEDVFYLLSYGGSLGAEGVNAAALDLMRDVTSKTPNVRHLHASGKRDGAATRARFAELGLTESQGCILTEYIYDMPLQMAAADLVIARAGAMTLSELAKMRKPSILIPSPYVPDDHQTKNARALSDVGAAILLPEATLPGGSLTEAVTALLEHPERLREMEERLTGFDDVDANRVIWEQIKELTT